MSCKLIMHWQTDGEPHTREQIFDQSPVTIGRGVGNDCVLKDSTRVVSTKHAELRERRGVWWVCDVGSVNGTILNGTTIAPKKEYELHEGDQLAVGPYRLEFRALSSPAIHPSGREVESPVMAPPSASSEDCDRLRYLMHRAYGECDRLSGTSIEQHLESVLHHALVGYDQTRAQSTVQALRVSLQRATSHTGESHRDAPRSQPAPIPDAAVPPRKVDKHSSLSGNQAMRVYEELGVPGSSLNADQMAKHVAAVLSTLFAGLADTVQGRRAFQKEFEVEATRILAWKPNPLKYAESAAEIATVLLDPASCELTDQEAITSLRDVLQDLTLHQLGLMAGFRECLRGLMKELDPDRIGQLPTSGSKGSKLGLLSGGTTRAEAAAWRRYVETYHKLIEEEVKVFERILAPHFAKGYLSIHKTRKQG